MDMNTIPVFDKFNLFIGLITAVFSYAFGKYWFLFVGYLILNVFDYISGITAAYLKGVTSSEQGLKGLVKKLGYWLMIGLAFLVSVIFKTMGDALGIDLGITIMLGYATLASLIVNEIRSILENLVKAGYHPPKVLTKGLEVANKALDLEDEEDEDDG